MLTNPITNPQIHWNTPDGAQVTSVAYIIQHNWIRCRFPTWKIVAEQGTNPQLAPICSGEKEVVLLQSVKMRQKTIVIRHNRIQYIEEVNKQRHK